MVSQRALYWIAVGLMVPLLGSHFALKYDRRPIEAGHVLAMAQRVLGRAQSFDPVPPVETRFASMQAKIAQRQAACARMEATRARMMALEQIESERVHGICPRPRIRIRTLEQPLASEGNI
jgi:hypothetical protein